MALERVAKLEGGLSISVGRATPEVVEAIYGLFRRSDSPNRTDVLEWHYLGRPGGAYVAIAHEGSDLVETAVAAYSAFPVPFRAGGLDGSAVQSFDTLTLPTHRGRGLFARLASHTYELATESGELAVFGFPNDQSVTGFTGRLGWTVFGQVPFMARPIGFRYVLSRAHLRRAAVDSTSSLSGLAVDEYLRAMHTSSFEEQQASDRGVGVRMTTEYLTWRLRRPDSTYRVHVTGKAGNEVPGIAITEVAEKHGATLGYLLSVSSPAASGSGREALRLALRDVRDRGADLCLAWSGRADPRRGLLARSGFVPLPERLRPIELNFGFRAFHRDVEEAMANPRHWRLSYLDSDTV